MFRTDDGSLWLKRPKVMNGCDETVPLFTWSTNYLYPSKHKQIQPKTLILTYMYTDAQTNRDLPRYTTTIK